MQVDTSHLQALGQTLMGLRQSGQFCDAMVIVGSTRLLTSPLFRTLRAGSSGSALFANIVILQVHKVVLSAASQTLHDLAEDFDQRPNGGDRDQLEIVIPSDVRLSAVNMFINYLYSGQLQLSTRTVGDMQRLATMFEVDRLGELCDQYSREHSTPDTDPGPHLPGLHLSGLRGGQIEPDSSTANGTNQPLADDVSLASSLSRNNSVCSNISLNEPTQNPLPSVSIKTEPPDYTTSSPAIQSSGLYRGMPIPVSEPQCVNAAGKHPPKHPMSFLEKLMSPVVNVKKLPSTITPDTVVILDDSDDEATGSVIVAGKAKSTARKLPKQYTLEEKEQIALEAKRFGTTTVSNSHNIPLPDILSWMTLFGLRHPGNQKSSKLGKQVNYEADLSIVRWIVQQSQMHQDVSLESMRKYAITVYRHTHPKFVASKTWLGNFLKRNMSVLQGTKFVTETGTTKQIGEAVAEPTTGKDEANMDNQSRGFEGLASSGTVLESIPAIEDEMTNSPVDDCFDDNDDDDNNIETIVYDESPMPVDRAIPMESDSNAIVSTGTNQSIMDMLGKTSTSTPKSMSTQFGKRPIIVAPPKSLDAKSERKLVQWVLEQNAENGYVFTDDFKDFAKSLYTGTKKFAATQAWMIKFLRRNRALKDVKFCSKYKNQYSDEEKEASVALARRFGVSYAAKRTGLNHKIIHAWKMKEDRDGVVPNFSKIKVPISRPQRPIGQIAAPPSYGTDPASYSGEAARGIVPEFENSIVEEVLQLQAKEGCVSYDDISQIAQVIYRETRPGFKACYRWVKNFLERHQEELKNIELANISRVLAEDEGEDIAVPPTANHISEMVTSALENIDGTNDVPKDGQRKGPSKRPIVVGPAVTFNRKTEKLLVDWVVERNKRDGYVFTDDFRDYAKSKYTGKKNFSASSGWLQLFLRRHREIKNVSFKSKYKSQYTDAEKEAAVEEARRYGTGHVGRKLGIDPSLLSAWKMKMEQDSHKSTFWKWGKSRKLALGLNFGKSVKLQQYKMKLASDQPSGFEKQMDAARGIVPEFENRIVEMVLDQHNTDGSISYEDISKISQSVYKETRPTFKAAYGWIRSFLKRHENALKDIDIENIKKVFLPDDAEMSVGCTAGYPTSRRCGNKLGKVTHVRPIIIAASRTLDTKTEKKLVQWLLERQAADGYVFLDQFKEYAKSLYKGSKKFAATRAWMIKFLRRNHATVKDVKFTSRFRREYTHEEKTAIIEESRKYGIGHVARKTGVDHCLIYTWKVKMDKEQGYVQGPVSNQESGATALTKAVTANSPRSANDDVGPGLYSVRGIVPLFEKQIVRQIMEYMDEEGSVSYEQVSRISRAIYTETRPNFKASYNWVKEFIKRHKKALRHVEFDSTKKLLVTNDSGEEVLIAADKYLENTDHFVDKVDDSVVSMVDAAMKSIGNYETTADESATNLSDPIDIVIDNPEDPDYETLAYKSKHGQAVTGTAAPAHQRQSSSAIDITNISARKPIIVGAPVTFDRKTEKILVQWLLERQARDSYVFQDDFKRFARSQYKGHKKFGATNAWLTKFLRRNRITKSIKFMSRLKGNNPKFEEKIISLILEHQQKEGSVSYNDIQRITQSVYKDTRPNFRACYNWTRDFIKRHKQALNDVELENVKKYFYPGDEEKDGVLIRDIDPLMGLPLLDNSSEIGDQSVVSVDDFENAEELENEISRSSWIDLDTTAEADISQPIQSTSSSSDILEQIAQRKRPIIVAPPKMLDIKTEKKLVAWMQQKQEEQGCVYLDVFKDYAKSLHEGPKHFSATNAWMTRFMQRNHNTLKHVKVQSRFRRDYSVQEKISAVEEARRFGCHHVGRKLGINGGVIYSWKAQMDSAERLTGSAANAFTDGGVSLSMGDSEMKSCVRGMVPEFEERIVAMVLQLQESKGSVTNDEISQISKSIYQETRPNFQASYNWVIEFIRRYKKEFKDVVFENQKKHYTEDQKLQILAEEKKYGTDHVVQKRKVSASTLYQWRRNMRAKSIPIPVFRASVFSSTMGLSTKIKKKYGKKTQRTFTMEQKRSIVAEAEKNGVSHAAVKLNVTKNMIYRWIQCFREKGEEIVLNNVNTPQLKKDLEQGIVQWVLEQNDELGIVTTHRIQEHAQKIFKDAYTMFNATTNWLEGFLVQNAESFEKVRFRDSDDTDREFTDEIKQKLARHATKHGAVKTADLTDLTPGYIYHVKAIVKKKALLLPTDSKVDLDSVLPSSSPASSTLVHSSTTKKMMGPKSKMKEKLDRIGSKFSAEERQNIAAEANVLGTSATASKYGIPLPLIFNWVKLYANDVEEIDFQEDTGFDSGTLIKTETVEEVDKLISASFGSSNAKNSRGRKSIERESPSVQKSRITKLNVRLPAVEKKVMSYNKYSEEFKKTVCEVAKQKGVKAAMKEMGIPNSTLYSWMKEYGSPEQLETTGIENTPSISSVNIKQEMDTFSENPGRPVARPIKPFTLDEKRVVIAEAQEYGNSETAKKHGISEILLLEWINMYKDSRYVRKLTTGMQNVTSSPDSHKSSTPDRKSATPELGNIIDKSFTNSEDKRVNRVYSDEERTMIIEQARQIGCKATARKTGVPVSNVTRWLSLDKKGSYNKPKSMSPSSSMLQVGKYRSISEDTNSTPNIRKDDTDFAENVTPQEFQYVAYDDTLDIEDYYMLDEKRSICAKAREKGVRQTSEEASVPINVLYNWMEKYKDINVQDGELIIGDFPISVEDTAGKLNTLDEADRIGVTAAAKNANIPAENIYIWRKEYTYNTFLGNEEVTSMMSKSGLDIEGVGSRKRKASSVEKDSGEPLSVKKFRYPRLSEDEKKAAVSESERIGCRTMAETIGISIDLMYKWRQQYKSTVLETKDIISTEQQSTALTEHVGVEADEDDVVLIEDDDFIITENDNIHEIDTASEDENVPELFSQTDIPSTGEHKKDLNNPETLNLNVGSLAKSVQHEVSEIPELESDMAFSRQYSEDRHQEVVNLAETNIPESQVHTLVSESSDFTGIQITNVKSEFSGE